MIGLWHCRLFLAELTKPHCRNTRSHSLTADQLPASPSYSCNHRSPHHGDHSTITTLGDWALAVAAACTWNSLPQHVTSTGSMPVSEDASKLPLQAFHPLKLYHNFCSACTVAVVIFGDLDRSFYLLTYLLFLTILREVIRSTQCCLTVLPYCLSAVLLTVAVILVLWANKWWWWWWFHSIVSVSQISTLQKSQHIFHNCSIHHITP